MEKQIPELLAPAGSMDALKAAVNSGADAVYLAGKQFGARHFAANFDDKELKEAVNFAHLRGVNVYVTVNTLIKDKELKEVAKYLIFLYEIGVDAILVQDVGVASLARKLVPDLKIHASTQMTIHNLEGVKWASKMGFKRVVLSREMELSEIERINSNIKSKEIELEIFVHGALCYSYSGQCIISSVIGGRSGNKGMCAQPCRRQYDLVLGNKDEYGKPAKLSTIPLKDKYLLSTRDLALYEHLNKIIGLDVASLKIEGRMRSPEYVAIVVSIYRKALDSISRGKWKPKKEDIANLKLAFNRDFTSGYIFENSYGKVMGRDRPGNRGIYLGSLKKYDKKTKEALVKIEGDIFPQKGDGIVFISKNKDQKDYGMLINESPQIKKDKVKFKVQRYLNTGTSLYLTRRKVLVDTAQKIISGSESELKKSIPVDLDILIQNDGTIFLKSSFNGAYGFLKLEMVADFKMERAINKPLDEKIIVKQFKKTGNTPFKVKNMNINYPGDLFAPMGELNGIRREMFEKIEEKIISSYRPSEDKVETSYGQLKALYKEFYFNDIELNKSPDLCVYVDDLEVLKSAVACGCDKIYFNPFNLYNPIKCNSKNEFRFDRFLGLINEALYVCRENRVDFVLKLPKITSSHFLDNLKPILMHVFEVGVDRIMVDGIGTAKFIFDLNPNVNLFASSGLNIWNVESINVLQVYFKSFTVSPELSGDEIRNLISKLHQREINVALELIVQGNLESLISKDCLPCLIEDEFFKREMSDKVFLGIKDVKGHVFPLRLDNGCRTHILNSVELSLIDYMPQIIKMGIDTVLIDLEGRTGRYAEILCSVYKNVIEMDLSAQNGNNLKKMKGKVKKISIGGITTGNFLRGTVGK
jgi:putative protease